MLAGLIKWSHGRPLFPKDGEKLPGTTSFIQWPPVYTFLMLILHSGNRPFSSAIPQAVSEIIRIDFTVLQTGEVDFKKNQKFLFFVLLVYSWVTCSRKILILLATACHLDLKERSVKVRISYKVLHILSGLHYKTWDCRAVKNLLFLFWHFDN